MAKVIRSLDNLDGFPVWGCIIEKSNEKYNDSRPHCTIVSVSDGGGSEIIRDGNEIYLLSFNFESKEYQVNLIYTDPTPVELDYSAVVEEVE